MRHSPMTLNMKYDEPTHLTYPNFDDSNDDEWYEEIKKHQIQWMNEVVGNKDLVFRIMFEMAVSYSSHV
jgi:hypothetical protein